jgi:DNA-binding transcriptional regulator YiaG
MPNLAAVLRQEVCRLAEREIKSQTSATKQALVQFRRDIADLKRQVREQAKEIAVLKAQERKRLRQPSAKAGESPVNVRFSPRSVKAQRRRLRLSAAEYGKLVGVSGLTIYHWEHGQARPQKRRLAALVAIRGLGRREALEKLGLLKADAIKIKRQGRGGAGRKASRS